MNKLVALTNTHEPSNVGMLLKSAQRVGVELVTFGAGLEWPHDFVRVKIEQLHTAITRLPPDVTHVMWLDGNDSLLLGDSTEILRKFKGIGFPIVISGEKNCYPNVGWKLAYPSDTEPYPWRYVNSGGWIAERAFAEGLLPVLQRLATFCDQTCWTMAYLLQLAPIVVDLQCEIFQTMFMSVTDVVQMTHSGRLYNTLTGTLPTVGHWNGRIPGRDMVWERLYALEFAPEPVVSKGTEDWRNYHE